MHVSVRIPRTFPWPAGMMSEAAPPAPPVPRLWRGWGHPTVGGVIDSDWRLLGPTLERATLSLALGFALVSAVLGTVAWCAT